MTLAESVQTSNGGVSVALPLTCVEELGSLVKMRCQRLRSKQFGICARDVSFQTS